MTSEYVESVTVELALVQSGEPITIHITGQLENVPLTMEIITRYLEQEFPVGDGIRVLAERVLLLALLLVVMVVTLL